MNILYFLVGCSVLMALVFLAAFFWASKTGQHDDVYTPAMRILFDDEPKSDDNHISNQPTS
ncbi:cytochrome oxidase maturation protein [Pedobacter kyungheensis]|uniref:Cytochrome oxidase maturation protein n=1 Tax=Pedobacter kyungheensis TaxID=1069985 RepID=A0A0C1FPC5_9SPHI|nr:cbb3-type cytochrome oxidase assembly protein CcoS [Pedobacter kyungheensis]KIA93548.1 cytochrome oxidase maturation protein [Pedobacter kyungheensis]